MIKLLRIEAVNIRSIGHGVVEPLTDPGAVTALNGPVGSGKSSMFMALLWALYGVTPDGVPVKAMRRQGSTGECKAVVTFEHDGQVITVERGLKGAKDATYARVLLDGREAVVGASQVPTWVSNRLGLDAEGFLTAFLVRQKELDALVDAQPAQRRQLIERLAGIDRMSTAIQAARAEEIDIKRQLEVMPGSQEAVDAARAVLEEAQQAAAAARDAVQRCQQEADEAEAGLAKARAEAAKLDQALAAHQQAREAAQAAHHEARLAAAKVEAVEQQLTKLLQQAQGGSADDVAKARAAYQEATQAAQADRDIITAAERAERDSARDQQRATQARHKAAQLRQAAAKAQAAAEQAATRATSYPQDLDQQIEAAQQAADTAAERVGELRGEYERLAKAINTLAEATQPCCPTCQRDLDDPKGLIETLRGQLDRITAEGKAAAADQKAATERVAALREQATQAARAQQDARFAGERAQQAEQDATQAEKEAAEAEAEAARSLADAKQAQVAAQAARNRAAEVKKAVEDAAAALRRAESAFEAAQQIPEALRAVEQARRVADTKAAEAKRLAAAEQSARVDEAYRRRVQDAVAEAEIVERAAARQLSNATTEWQVAQERLRVAERDLHTEETKLRRRAQLTAQLEAKTAVREALVAFRQDRLARLAPELSETATDFITRMTDGKYVAVELDENFTPTVVDARGVRRPLAMLSGGEESSVALALRIAIGELISGQRGGLLVLDEPFGSQDALRRAGMMAAIRELPGRQVIIVCHHSEATDMVDLVLDVVPDDTDGATIVPAVTYGVVEETRVDEPELVAALTG